MKVNIKSIIFTVLTFIILVVFPLAVQKVIPLQFLEFLITPEFNLPDLLNKIALMGFAMTMITLLKGFTDKVSVANLALSIILNLFWLLFTFFTLSLGRIENLGLTSISFETIGILNTVIFDLRLFIYLTTLLMVLKMAHSILKFKEDSLKSKNLS